MRRICLVLAALATVAPVLACGGEEPTPVAPQAVATTPAPPSTQPAPEPVAPPKPSMADMEKEAMGESAEGSATVRIRRSSRRSMPTTASFPSPA